jgi:hypothetical protein
VVLPDEVPDELDELVEPDELLDELVELVDPPAPLELLDAAPPVPVEPPVPEVVWELPGPVAPEGPEQAVGASARRARDDRRREGRCTPTRGCRDRAGEEGPSCKRRRDRPDRTEPRCRSV